MPNTKKLTAANCPVLAETKRLCNHKIFRQASLLRNAQGLAATVEYLAQFTRTDLRQAERERLLALAGVAS